MKEHKKIAIIIINSRTTAQVKTDWLDVVFFKELINKWESLPKQIKRSLKLNKSAWLISQLGHYSNAVWRILGEKLNKHKEESANLYLLEL